jgi:monoamine oxidase
VNRRRFLDLAAAAAVSLPLLGASRPVVTGPETAPPMPVDRAVRGPVAVIGAGLAGLAAADALRGAGVEVVVVEARGRVGGRVLTDHTLEVPVDLGAAWVHGDNPVRKHLLRAGGGVAATTDYESFVAFDVDGRRLGLRELLGPVARLEGARRLLARLAREAAEDMSVAEALDHHGALDGLAGCDERVTDFLYYTVFQQPFAVPPELLSLRQLPTYHDYPGPEYLPSGGMAAVLDLFDPGPDVRLGTEVTAVTVARTGVEIATTAGGIEADRCICAVPLAVLQREAIAFRPDLPAGARRGFDRLVVGDFYKLALRFDEVFWRRDRDFTASIGQAGRHGSGRHVGFLHLDRAHRTPVLVMIAGAALAAELEHAGRDAAVDFALDRLRLAYGDDVSAPVAAVATRWRGDALTGGAYTNYGVGSTADDVRAFHRLVGGRLTFAGEHTSVNSPSTVHGAVDSGRRAAAAVCGV